MRSYSHLSEDEKRPDRRFAGRGAVDGGHCPGARSGESHHRSMIKVERLRTADCVVGGPVSAQSDQVGPLMLALYNPQGHCHI